MTVKEKAELIVKDIKKERGTNPVVIFKQIAEKEYVSIHGPEHHILDGASLLVAYKNAGGEIDLEQALERLMAEDLRMPGAMCGLWGICGAITSIGAALAIIDGTGPLSTDGTWGNHMQFTSKAIGELGTINGPRCCKRDAMIAFKNEAFGRHLASDVFQSYSAGTETKPRINQDAVRIMKELYNIDMEAEGQFSKLVSDIPDPDIAISMGCNVGCPFIGRPFDDNWGLEDPTGKSDEEFKIVIEQIKHDILELKSRLNHNEI